MTSRERVLQAINHQRTDRAPADYGAHQEVSNRLMQRLGITDEEQLLQALHIDMRRISCNYGQPNSEPDADGYVRNMWGARKRTGDLKNDKDGRPNFISPFDEDTTVDDVHAHPWPDPAALNFSEVPAQCVKYHGEYATFGAPWSPFFHEAGWLIGQEDFYIWMTTKPEVTQAIIDHIVDYEIDAARRFFGAADGKIDIAYFGNDFGTQRGLFISRAMWEKFIRSPLKRYYDVAHEHDCKVMQHSCGAIREIIPLLIEDGVDILDPIQVAAAGMSLESLIQDFGSRLAFHGGVDTQRTLPFGSAAEVREEVRSYLDLAREKSGYILCGSQEFIEDIPVDNILAMYDENAKGR